MLANGPSVRGKQVTLPIDTSIAIRGLLAQTRLVEAVRDAPASEPETDYLEWKSAADIKQKKWWYEASRHILGFSNRESGLARTWFEGTAYLLFGVEPGALTGTRVCDPADIDKWVKDYTGDDPESPRWSFDYVTVAGHAILIFTVEAPHPGESIRTLRKSWSPPGGSSVSAGEIYIRKRGRTERADPGDISMLVRRVGAGQPQLKLAVVANPDDEAEAVDDSSEAIERWVAPRRQALLSGIRRPAMGPYSFSTEPRSEPSFVEEVETWANSARRGLASEARRELVTEGVGDVRFRVENPTDDNFEQVIVEVTFEDPDVEAYWVGGDVTGPPIGRKPDAWESSMLGAVLYPTVFDNFTPAASRPRPTIRRDKAGRCVVESVPVDIRPNSEKTLPAVAIVVPARLAGAQMTATWRVTAAGLKGDQRGEVVVRVRAEAIPVDRVLKAD
jgi:hypothetical protein